MRARLYRVANVVAIGTGDLRQLCSFAQPYKYVVISDKFLLWETVRVQENDFALITIAH